MDGFCERKKGHMELKECLGKDIVRAARQTR